MAEPIPLNPTRHEQRGMFPPHSDEPQPLLSGEDARNAARFRLIQWLAAHRGD